jgi:hypothetical protein
MYDIFDGQVARYAAYTGPLETSYAECGDVHYPPNTTQAYDYSNTQTVQSDCVTYNPGDPGSEREIATNVATWRSVPCDPSIQTNQGDCDQQSYLMWWMENMPGASNTVLDCGGSAMPNWWQYILALDSVTTTTSNQCQSDIRLNPSTGPSPASVSVAGSYFGPSETVRIYWDSTTSAPLGTTTTSNNGSFGISVRIPRSAAGTHTVIGVGATSGSKASATFTVTTKKQ